MKRKALGVNCSFPVAKSPASFNLETIKKRQRPRHWETITKSLHLHQWGHSLLPRTRAHASQRRESSHTWHSLCPIWKVCSNSMTWLPDVPAPSSYGVTFRQSTTIIILPTETVPLKQQHGLENMNVLSGVANSRKTKPSIPGSLKKEKENH